MNLKVFIIAALLAFIPWLSIGCDAAWARNAERSPAADPSPIKVKVRDEQRKTFDRILLTHPASISIKVVRDGELVTITFSAPINLDTALFTSSNLTRIQDFKVASPVDITFRIAPEPQATIKTATLPKGRGTTVDIYGESPLVTTSQPVDTPTPETIAVTAPTFSQSYSSEPRNNLPLITEVPQMVLSLDPTVDAAVAVFSRAGYCTVIFDRPINVELDYLTRNTTPLVTPTKITLSRNSGFRFAIPDDAAVSVKQEGTAWQIWLGTNAVESANTIEHIVQAQQSGGASILLPLREPSQILHWHDPTVGDDLLIVPLHGSNAIPTLRTMIDFQILQSAQGLVLKKITEKVVIQPLTEGLSITAAGGLRLSPTTDVDLKNKVHSSSNSGMFDFTAWKGKNGEYFTEMRQRLIRIASKTNNKDINNRQAYLELARSHLAHGMGNEALSILNILIEQTPPQSTISNLVALRGIANTMAANYNEALQDFDSLNTGYRQEIELWRAVSLLHKYDWDAAAVRFWDAAEILDNYPDPIYSYLIVLALEATITAGKNEHAEKLFKISDDHPHIPNIDPALSYLRGVLTYRNGNNEEAQKLWTEASKSNDHLYKIRAELALIDFGIMNGSLTPGAAAERLEGLRFAWRGDGLELDILHRLGSFYLEKGDNKTGLLTLGQTVRLFPEAPEAQKIQQEIYTALYNIFKKDSPTPMPPMEALSLYQELKPVLADNANSQELHLALADRLVEVDLLEQAADIITNQMRTTENANEKAGLGARAAAIRLLDRQPQAALDTLHDSNAANIGSEITDQRQYLEARALSELGQIDNALNLLRNKTNEMARILYADITMRGQRWAEAATVLDEIIGSPPQGNEELAANKEGLLVNRAAALAMIGNKAALDKMAADFGKAMDKTAHGNNFRMLTRPNQSKTINDIASAQSTIGDIDMFINSLNTYRKTKQE